VPSYYGLNRLPADAPVIGKVVTGGREQSVVAYDVDITGPAADPKVSVKLFSALAPGPMRDLMRRLR
jgi:hypothetical protein